MLMSAVVVAITGGYFAYEHFKPKPSADRPAATRKASSDPQGGSESARRPSGSQGGSQAGSEAGSAAEEPATKRAVSLAVPDLKGLTPDQARAKLVGIGFKDDALQIPKDMGCSYDDEKQMVKQGTICNQDREPGGQLMSNAKLRVVVENDTYEHGGVESGNEWNRMPELTGMPLARAQALLRDRGFADDEFVIGEARTSCGKGKVCEQRPKADLRKFKSTPGELNIGD